MPDDEEVDAEVLNRREKKLRQSRILLRLLPLGWLLSGGLLGDSLYHFVHQPGVVTALKLLPPLGVAIIFSGLWHEARQTLRNNGADAFSMWSRAGIPLVVAGRSLPIAYERGDWVVFYGAGGFTLLILLAFGGIAWLQWRDARAA